MTADGPCFDPRDAATVAGLPDDHPLRAHARECPRCRALLDSYAAFATGDPGDVPAADLADADARLTRALANAIGAPAPAPTAARPAADRDPSVWERLWHPAMRPALAFAALALVAGAIVWWPREGGHGGAPTMRGEARAGVLEVTRAEWADGTLRLAWRPVAGAEDYELRCFSSALAEIGRVGPLTGDRADIATSRLPAAAGDTLLVRVVALAGGDPIATSAARVIVRR